MKNRKKEILLLMASTLIALLLAVFLIEIYHYVKNRNYWVSQSARFDPELGWSNIPGYSAVENGQTVTTNSLGLRSDEIDPSRDHVLIVGDSVAFGVGVSDHETLSYYLNQKLKEVQVLNLAVSGYGIDQYYLALSRYIDQTNPRHIIVVIYTGNDLADTRSDNLFGISKPLFRMKENQLTNLRPVISRYSCTNLLSRSWIAKRFHPFSLAQLFCRTTELGPDASRETIKGLFSQMSQLASRHGADLSFVLSPTLIGVQWNICNLRGLPPSCAELDSGFQYNYSFFLEMLEHSSYKFLDFNNDLMRLYVKNHIDLKSFYNNKGKDVHHYSPRGNRLLAERIARFLNKKSSGPLAGTGKAAGRGTLDKQAQAYFDRGFEAWTLGQNEKAVREFKNFLQARPQHAEGHFLLGLTYKNSGQVDKAVREIQTSVRLDPKKPVSHNVLGSLYLKTKNFQSAIREFIATLEIMPDYPDAYFNLGLAFDGIGDGPNAALNILMSSKLYEHAEQNALKLLAQQKLAEVAKKYGLNMDNLNKRYSDPKWWVAMVESNILKKLSVDDPDNINRRYRLGLAYLGVDQYAAAIREFKKTIEIFPDAALAFNNRGFALIKTGKYQEAIKAFQEALRINKYFGFAHLNLGAVYDLLGDGKQSIVHVLRAKQLFKEAGTTKHEATTESNLKYLFQKYNYRPEDFPEYNRNGEQES